ncbi:hypothetical protein BTO06_10265 [Tenacibaculum sp. SZ-18]|nr:hypothetical protein BTO06_10265 [Tenacibaculum sp. SZ-18]
MFLIWLQFVIYLVHQFEEYVLPGGFLEFLNKELLGSAESDFPADKKFSFWINIPIIFVGYPVSAILSGYIDLSIGIWTAYFSIINAMSHVGMFLKHKYNPGFFISLFLNIPVGIYTIYYFVSQNLISLNSHIIGLIIGLLVQGFVMMLGFKVLKPTIKDN